MADAKDEKQVDPTGDGRGAAGDKGAPGAQGAAKENSTATDWSNWSSLWQVPTLLLGGILIIFGLYTASTRTPQNDFDGALKQIETFIADREFDLAATQLNDVILPNLSLATSAQQGHSHALAGDWVSLLAIDRGELDSASAQRAVEEYAAAGEKGWSLTPAQVERWAEALIRLGEIDAARLRLDDLEAATLVSGDRSIQRRRNNVLRQLVNHSLRQPDASFDSMLQLLTQYRNDEMLNVTDMAWAIVGQAALRLENGEPQRAVDYLLVDMRRLEQRLTEQDEINFGDMYTLLAQGYFNLGKYRDARFYVDRALREYPEAEAGMGVAMVLMGQLVRGEGRFEEALEYFDQVVRDFPTTKSYLPAVLGRAELRGITGNHLGSLSDYALLHEELSLHGPQRGLTTESVGLSLIDRHDAALAMEKLDLALKYVLLAEKFFTNQQMPPPVLARVGSVSRQIARNLIQHAMKEAGIDDSEDVGELDPSIRYEAAQHFKRAGEYSIQHARVLMGSLTEDEAWADSLWLAADSFDLGGFRELAIQHFAEYIAARAEDDPRRAEATYRLAQAHYAQLDYEAAVDAYQKVTRNHPRSPFASRSHVPLARCLVELNRNGDAKQQLLTVVDGQAYLQPDASDYRDALIELGRLYYQSDDFARAIERLTEARDRYPDDRRISRITFDLADSYRQEAGEIRLRLQDSAGAMARVDSQRLDQTSATYLQTAMDMYGYVIIDLDAADARSLNKIHQEMQLYAHLYQADCAYDLGRYEQSISLYDETARQFSRHPASMQALVQIVNAYTALQNIPKARSAHTRALARLKQLPDEAFQQPGALLNRRAWEQWLQNSPLTKFATP